MTPSTVDTTGKSWLYEPLARTEETKTRYTIEEGSTVRAGKATYGTVTGATFTFNRTAGVTITGDGFAQQYQDNIALTGSPTVIEEAIILPTHLNVYVNDTFGAIGTTKFTRDFNAVCEIGGVVGPGVADQLGQRLLRRRRGARAHRDHLPRLLGGRRTGWRS